MVYRDWRKALRTPPSYRVGNSRLHFQIYHLAFVVVTILLFIVALLAAWTSRSAKKSYLFDDVINKKFVSIKSSNSYYNSTYPLTSPVSNSFGVKYKIGLISDLDKKSKIESEYTWISYFKKGHLLWNPLTKQVLFSWDDGSPSVLKSKFGENGRGMELSELIVFNGKLLTFDDRTGLIYEIDGENSIIPWVILMDGNGRINKGFKSEWAAVKDSSLYIGSMGKEWTSSTGDLINHNPMWVKTVSINGEVEHQDWKRAYMQIRRSVDIEFPGYMIHESGCWSSIHKKWFFLPRRMSKDKYNDNTDERMSTNVLIITDEYFQSIQVKYIDQVVPTHGYSSFKFIPGTNDEVIVAIKSEENNEVTATYIIVFDLTGTILVPETKIADIKYEGIEFI